MNEVSLINLDSCAEQTGNRQWCERMCKDIIRNSIVQGNTLDLLKCLAPNSIDAIITDPPYGINFAKEKWDNIQNYKEWGHQWARMALAALKPGGYLVAMGSPRTVHQLASGIEDAGFEIKDMLMWQYATGFPKSYDISKAFDKQECVKSLTQKIGRKPSRKEINAEWKTFRKMKGMYVSPYGREYSKEKWAQRGLKKSAVSMGREKGIEKMVITSPRTYLAKKWDGWNTALKPAHEPIVLAQKPLEKNYTHNIQKWNIGAISIDATRILYQNAKRYPSNVIRTDPLNDNYDKYFLIPKPSPSEKQWGCAVGTKCNEHSTVKPVELMRHLINLFTPKDAIVLDPFIGSGTTAIAAKELCRNFIGIDLDATIAQRRIKTTKGCEA